MEGVGDQPLEDYMPKELAEYIRSVADNGIRTRFRGSEAREKAKQSPTLQGHILEAYERNWEDVAEGRALVCDARVEDRLEGLISAPSGRFRNCTRKP